MQGVTQRENLRHAPPQKVSSRCAQKFFRRRTDHYGARVPGEQQQAVLEPRHDGIHIFAHGTEDFMHAAQLLADLCDFPAHQPEFIAASRETLDVRRRRVILSCRDTIQVCGDIA